MGHQSTQITKQEFLNQMARLSEVYGEDKYPQGRINIFWERFKNYTAHIFESAVSKIIGEARTAPMIKEISDAIAEVSEWEWEKKKRDEGTMNAETFRKLTEHPENYVSFSEYIRNLVDNESRTEDFRLAVKVYGLEKMDKAYKALQTEG